MKRSCLEGIENNVFLTTGDPYNMGCDYRCSFDQYDRNNVAITLEIIGRLGAVFNFPLTQFTEPYSYIQVDFSFLGVRPANPLNVDINGLAQITLSSSPTQSYLDDAPTLFCSGFQVQNVYTSTLILNQQLPLGTNVIVTFSIQAAGYLSLLRSIRISKNCTPNCKTCSTNSSCLTCQDGYNQYNFPSGPQVCEQVGVCQTSNCFSCAQYNNQEVCLKCKPGFVLNSSSQTCTANIPAPQVACQANQYNQDGVCTNFSSNGYYQDRLSGQLILIQPSQINVQTTYQCPQNTLAIVSNQNNYQDYQCRCIFQNCIGCQDIYSCTYCVPGMIFNNTSKSCQTLNFSSNSYTIKQKVDTNGYKLELVFQNQLIATTINQSNLNITISNFKNYTYQFMGQKDNYTLMVDIQCDGNIKNEYIYVTISDKTFLSQNLMKPSTVSQELDPFVYVSPTDLKQAQDLKTGGTAVATTMISCLIPIAFLGNFYVLINTIDLTGFLYYLLFINVRFPINIFQFYGIFQNFQMAFIPNFFQNAINPNYVQQAPPQFMQQQTDSYFLNSTGQSISVVLIIFCLYIFAKLFSGIEIKFVQAYCRRACYETWEYGGFFDLIWCNYTYIIVGIFLQFYIFDCGDSSCPLNYSMFALWIIICLGAPIIITYVIVNNPNIKDDKYMRTKYSSLISGLKLFSNKDSLIQKDDENNTPPQTNNLFQSSQSQSQLNLQQIGWRQKLVMKFSKYNLAILYYRKIIFALIIVYLYKYSYIQLGIITLMNVIVAAYYIVIQPFESKYENIKNAAAEFVLIAIQIIIALLVDDPKSQPESHRITLGWIAIALITFVILWQFLGIIYDSLYSLYEYLKELKQKRNRSKVANFDNQQNEQANNEYASPSIHAKQRTDFQSKLGTLVFQNVKEMPREEDNDENDSPLQSQRLKRNKFSSVTQIRREGSINNMETFDQSNISPEVSPNRHRMSRLHMNVFNPQAQQMVQGQGETPHESIYDIPHSNNQIIGEPEQKNMSKKFSKVRSILES
ncbi:hypothetical protein TTHERM_00821940 (macronuclear) [Tetrahymena thermophila SB210]|uniref:Transmembrane protein n=1 Tax=Tetrahymena thermophila (strain SB210) TaxID=312017 RepID=Q22F15_TETTS|nr:hypothetical protein TTHERM_00821940 [Tetrahymena thermophila SB210]EAR83860.2 hypothetical protein TTHERM_00821940 [Tetrahymena thermophila SB210]|eukprot:XP_001031523.2 hypothetical protein TTHERM_00821940 [Tetrahymena thermophila SB210]